MHLVHPILLLCLLVLVVQGTAMRPTLAVTAQVQAAQAEVRRLEAEHDALLRLRESEEALSRKEARDIAALKEQGPSVARDLELGRLLAQAQGRASALSEKDARLARLSAQLAAARQGLVRACDVELSRAGLSSTERLDILRLRASQIERLAEPARGSTQALLRQAMQAQLDVAEDDPQRMREHADLLRDSADKVERELRRLEQRGEELQRRSKLRERAMEVDQDLFAEQVTTRRSSQGVRNLGHRGTASDAASAPQVGAESVPQPPTAPQATPPTRSAFDPLTMDLLRKAETSTDPEVRLQAIRRVQKELRSLADQLGRRATTLERQAEEMRRRK